MTIQLSLPFQSGDLAEAKSFQSGYRGAWFRCKIQEIMRKQRQIVYALEYYDYPGEKIKCTRIYQKPTSRRSSVKEDKRELMVRPHFPPIYYKNESPNVNTISEVVVVVDGVWRVGDLVDWCYEGCFWSGMIIEFKGDDEVKIKLPDPPLGEGFIYEARCMDLRPSLDWSLEKGWTVPKPLEIHNGRSCVRLIHPLKQDLVADPFPRSLVDEAEQSNLENVRATPSSLLEFNESTSSHTSTSSLPFQHKSMHSEGLVEKNNDISEKDMLLTHGAHIDPDTGGSIFGRPSCSDGVSSTCSRDASFEASGPHSAQEQYNAPVPAKKKRVNETISVNSVASDSIESAVINLEELVNKVKWLRRILKFEIPSSSEGPAWKFLQDPTVSSPK